MQVSLIFLSFFIILYWLLQLGGATFIQPFAPFFETIKDITHLFYVRTVKVDEVTIDFAFLVATFAMLLLVWGLKFVIEFIETLEKKYDTAHKCLKQKRENAFNRTLEKQHLISEYKYNNFLIFVKFSAINLLKDSFFHKDVEVGVEEKQTEVLRDFSKNLTETFQCQKKFINEGLLLYFNNFDNVDKILVSIGDNLLNIQSKYVEEKWEISYLFGVDAYSESKEITAKVENLMKLTNLGLKNRKICFSQFKQRYLLLKSPKYNIEGAGVYQLTNTEEEVFYLNNLR